MEDVEYCSNCRKNICGKNYTVHAVHCQRNLTVCNICNTAVSKSQYKVHLSTCHANTPCPECSQVVDICDLVRHQKEDCIMRNKTCKYCEIELKSRDMASHVEFCASRTERCKGCTKHVQKKFLQFHYENDHKYMTPDEKGEAEGSGGEDGEECPICLGPITLPIALECGHVFCMVCVKGIASTTKNCAICRRDINRDMLMDIRFCREEDVIKNYVKNPKCKKFSRSKSVPSRSSGSGRVGAITEDYDSMVSALLSNKVSSSSYRYERPANTHTPPTYTPYCYASSSLATAESPISSTTFAPTTVSSYLEADSSCRLPTEDNYKYLESSVSARSRVSVLESPSYTPYPSVAAESISTASSLFESRPRRPTSLALSSAQEDSVSTRADLPQLSQEEYDRWLAFQLSRSEEDIPPEEFNRRNRNTMRRSISMPESKHPPSSYGSELEDFEDQTSNSEIGLPPAAPRSSTASSPTKSNNARVANLVKSSSDPNSNGNTTVVNTGARPKCSTGLKKRVSFREEAPQKREAPVMLPCEFCNEMFCERDLMRHQTSCDFNETKNPREFLMARRSSAASSVSSPASPVSPSSPTSPSASSLPPLPSSSNTEHSIKTIPNKTFKTPPHSPLTSIATRKASNIVIDCPTHINRNSNTVDTFPNKTAKSSGLSPESGQSASSGICSATSSFSSSVSTTPSTSSSASPIPASTTPDTPTDVEADMEEDDTSTPRPRRGKFLSSAISSWRSISGSKGRSKSKGLQSSSSLSDSKEDMSVSGLATSSYTANSPQSDAKVSYAEFNFQIHSAEQPAAENFIRNRKTYRAPLPPIVKLTDESNDNASLQSDSEGAMDDNSFINEQEGGNFHFDSMPMMNGQLQIKEDVYHCENCNQPFSLRKLKCHQTVCNRRLSTSKEEYRNVNIPITKENKSTVHIKYRKGPAPQPPREEVFENDDSLFRFNSTRRRADSHRSPGDILDFSIGTRVERSCSVKEQSRFSRTLLDTTSFLTSRKWMSREVLFGGGTVEGSGGYSGGGSMSSSTTSLNSLPGSNVWTSQVGVTRDAIRSRRATTSLGLSSASLLLGASRYRERSLSRSRPSSLYSSSFYPHLCV